MYPLCMCLSVWSKQLMTSSRDGGLSTPSVCCSVVCTLCTLQYKVTPLMCAAGGGHTDVVQVLLGQQDVNINMRDKVCPSQWKCTLTITHVTACSCSSG